VKRSFITRLLIDGLGRIVIFGLIILLTRILGVANFGKLAFAISFSNIAYILSECGTLLLFLREMGNARMDANEQNRIWSEFIGLKAALVLLTCSLGFIVSFWIWPWDRPLIILFMLGWMVGNSFTDFYHQTCNATDHVQHSAIIMLLHRGLTIIGLLLAITYSKDLYQVSLGLCIGSLIGMAVSFFYIRRTLHLKEWPRWQPAIWMGWVKKSVPLALANIFGTTYPRLGIFMLPRLSGALETGLFGAAHRLFEVGYMVPSAFLSVTTPRLSRLIKEHPEHVPSTMSRLALYMGGLSIVWVIVGIFAAPLIIRLLFGAEYLPSTHYLRILLLSTFFIFMNYVLVNYLIVTDHLIPHATNEFIALLIGIPITYYFISVHGGAGASWALVVTELSFMLLTIASLIRLRHRLSAPERP